MFYLCYLGLSVPGKFFRSHTWSTYSLHTCRVFNHYLTITILLIFDATKSKRNVKLFSCYHYLHANTGTSLAVQWLRPRASTAGGMGSIPGWGTKIPHAVRCDKKKPRQYCWFSHHLRKVIQSQYTCSRKMKRALSHKPSWGYLISPPPVPLKIGSYNKSTLSPASVETFH